ncbi:hypothetical protein Tco_0536846 [Tanacetum coccineum]
MKAVKQDNESDEEETQSDSVKESNTKQESKTDHRCFQNEGADAQQWNENIVTTQEQVVDDAHVTISTVTKKTEGPVTSSSRSSDLASKFLNFLDIPHADAEIVSPLDVHVHHEVLRTHAPTLLTVPVSVITDSSPVYTNIPQSSQTFTPPPPLATPTSPPKIATTNPLSTLLISHQSFDSTIESQHWKKKLEEFMNFLLESLMARIKDQVKEQLLKNLPKGRCPPEHQDCYDSLKKSYNLNKDFFFSYDVYTMKRSRIDKDKDEDPSVGSDRGLKRRKTSKDADSTIGPKDKDSKHATDQRRNLWIRDDEPRKEDASRRDWFKKPTPPQEPIDPNWHEGKTP